MSQIARSTKSTLLLATIIFSQSLWASSPADSKTPTSSETIVAKTDLWCPLACQPGENPGLVVEILTEVMKKHGVKVEYSLLNWARTLEDTRAGKVDAVTGCAKTDAPDFIFPASPQAKVKFEAFTLKDKPWKYKGNFTGKKIGVINGYTYDETINKLIENKAPEFVVVSGESGLESLVNMLRAGRIDMLYENSGVFQNWLTQNKQNFSDFATAGAPTQDYQEIYVAFSPKLKNAKVYAAWVDEEMKAMKKNGKLAALKKKYKLNF